jgi:3',5'-cyclic AMP phosphodiesterase CpdA
MPSATILHLSDLHFGSRAHGADSEAIAASLCAAIGQAPAAKDERRLLAITGDIFDSSHLDPGWCLPRFLDLLGRIREAVGGAVPTVLLPGNHDRRRGGLIGPFRGDLFQKLAASLRSEREVHVAGCGTPFLAELLEQASAAVGAPVVAYDSTYLPSGFLSAGGVIHAEDLLHVAARLEGDRPLIMLLHHHLIPTPVTDVSRIDASSEQLHFKLFIKHALPKVVAHGDREELSMTAFGAGTALSMLHALRRAVLVLHGHKHYPTARVLHATRAGEGDIVITSAGSAGTTQAYEPTSPDESVQLWPSFNTVKLSSERLDVSTTFFSPRDAEAPPFVRALAAASREGERWRVEPVADPEVEAPPVTLDEAVFSLEKSAARPFEVWDFTCSRRIEIREGDAVPEYHEIIECARGSVCEGADIKRPSGAGFPSLRLRPGGATRYRLRGGLCRSIAGAERLYAAWDPTPFEWVGLIVRHRSRRARLVLTGLPRSAAVAFGSSTDLHTGRQRPHPVSFEDGRVILEQAPCGARKLLRIHWPLER